MTGMQPGPTLVSTETLEELCSWFDWDEQEVRRRLEDEP